MFHPNPLSLFGPEGDVRVEISKAFVKVWRASLLHKLSAYGARGKVFNIIRSFLQDRQISLTRLSFLVP